ncbi:chorismate synthase [Candidatus Wirthbacteria bacterium CG2_30_54_11]|uniref:Chorismate synthase n=1 Tax=Candidatus Wirthbacteria bacterium CG2_30_54_11 TaxID=1817892 RepID=A0A1J5IQ66_9BACT|nr:MAG: chorismate synthase [Candidatus Wirthbacteria bacterium CG2_30_54_11]
MAGNSFGELFRVTTWGESHGGAVGAVVDGCPSRLELTEQLIQRDLDRRKPGQSDITTARDEHDQVHILSGVFEGKTLGTPISLLVWNEDARSDDYLGFKDMYRPGHADYTYEQKYGIRNWQGGGRASARETIGRVAAGAVARLVLASQTKIEIVTYVRSVGDIEADIDSAKVTPRLLESNIVRCPDAKAAKKMESLIRKAKSEGDSIGGVVECIIRHVPVGLGEPVFDKLSADLAQACMSIPATKGFEIGEGFAASRMRGSEHNDPFVMKRGAVRTVTNHAGGILGGISSGEDIILRVAFKPASTIEQEQKTVSTAGKNTTMKARGRHDPCVVPRAVAVVEAMVAITLADHLLRNMTQNF